MEEHVRLIVLEHLSDKLDVHILDVDFLCKWSKQWAQEYASSCPVAYIETLVQYDDGFIQLFLRDHEQRIHNNAPTPSDLTTLLMIRLSRRFC